MRVRLGWLGPAIVIVGVLVAGVGIYIMSTSRPQAGDYIDVVALGERGAVAVRHEKGVSNRDFVELIENGAGVRWQALVPKYAGTPTATGLQPTVRVVNVRVVRGGRAEVFTLALADAVKVGGLYLSPDWPESPTAYTLPTGLSFNTSAGNFQVVGDENHGAVYKVSGVDGTVDWRFLATGGITDAFAIDDGQLAVVGVGGNVTVLSAETGAVLPTPTPAPTRVPIKPAFEYNEAQRVLTVGELSVQWPADAITPQTWHVAAAAGLLWLVSPSRLAVIDTTDMSVRWTSDGTPLTLTPAK